MRMNIHTLVGNLGHVKRLGVGVWGFAHSVLHLPTVEPFTTVEPLPRPPCATGAHSPRALRREV